MQAPIQVSFRSVEPSAAILAYVQAKASKLDALYRGIIACRVAVEAPHRQKRHGKRYRVRVDLMIPGHEIVSENASWQRASEDMYACIDAAFSSVKRLLSDRTRQEKHRLHSRETLREERRALA